MPEPVTSRARCLIASVATFPFGRALDDQHHLEVGAERPQREPPPNPPLGSKFKVPAASTVIPRACAKTKWSRSVASFFLRLKNGPLMGEQ